MSKTFYFRWIYTLIAALAIAGCGTETAREEPAATEEPVAEVEPAEAPAEDAPADIAADTETPEATEFDGTVYTSPGDLYSIGFPEDYSYDEDGESVTFVSDDEGFEGTVEVTPAEGETFDNDRLEEDIKTQFEDRYDTIEWQGSEIQPDDSIRLDWVGRNEGNDLDAITFVEQRGDNIYVLTLKGVNAAYSDYEDDAEQIVGTYNIME